MPSDRHVKILHEISISARRALRGRRLPNLVAYSFDFDDARQRVCLKAHFSPIPSTDEIEEIQVAETEILADFGPEIRTETEIEIVQDHFRPKLLVGGVAFAKIPHDDSANPP